MNRFFGKSENISDNQIIIDGSDVNHIVNVLRLKKGEKVAVSGGDNILYTCAIREFDESNVYLDILEKNEENRELPARIHLFQGLPKQDKMELIIQKCVELGVYEIIPVAMKRCVVKLDARKQESKIARWQGISESAAKQSKRTIIPNVHEVMEFDDALQYAKSFDFGMVPYELAEGMEATRKALKTIKTGMDVAVFIGPEGGFDLDEIEKSKAAGLTTVSLGKRILRTETAGLAVMAIIMYHLEGETE